MGMDLEEFSAAIGRETKTIRLAEAGNQALGRRSWERVEQLIAGRRPVYSQPSLLGGIEAREDPLPWGTPPAMIETIVNAVIDPAVRAAVDGMVAAGLTPRAAWLAILQAKLLAEGDQK